ncbi:MAG: hypothetical protein K8R69_05045 [Deltaproteobacteria bacterium]|nr:hypothetical protein [Deltaproteobacteria bacterium]
MEIQHLNVKIFAENSEGVDREKFTPVFHGWIQDQSGDELLLDVADYLHVPAGPGIVLIGEAADYGMDETGHRLGLRYNRKAKLEGSNNEKLTQALRSVLKGALKLESAPLLEGKLKFSRRELEFSINDRGIAPNTPGVWAELRGDFESFFSKAFPGNAIKMIPNPDPRQRFGVSVQTERPFDLEALLASL